MTNPTQTPNLEIRRVDEDLLVHDALHGKVHVLNRTAGTVLELCDGAHSVSDIVRSICEGTGADHVLVGGDVNAILQEFQLLKLLV